MIFRPLAIAAAFVGSIGLSSAEINYAYQSGEMVSTQALSGDAPNTAGILLASKSEFCVFLSSCCFSFNFNSLTFISYVFFVFQVAAPGSKDLMIFLSSEINLLTQTTSNGSNKGGKDTSEASAGLAATLKYCVDCPEKGEYDSVADAICNGGSSNVYEALPGRIVFASRRQTLSVDVDLDCNVVVDGEEADCEVTGYVEVDLTLDTTAAHTFNFIADVANTGTGSTNNPVQVVACFELDASAEADNGSAEGKVSLGSTMLIVQEASVSNFN